MLTPDPMHPPQAFSLPSNRSAELGKLTSEARVLIAERSQNIDEIDRRNTRNSAITDRLNRIDSEIRLHVWDGSPPASAR